MTITTEKIEVQRALLEASLNGTEQEQGRARNELRALLDLAQRAMVAQPQGQALPELVNDLRMYAGDSGYSHNDYADTMRQAADALASQLAPPAGPVPEGRMLTDEQHEAIRHGAELLRLEGYEQQANDLHTINDALQSSPSPAVALPDGAAKVAQAIAAAQGEGK